MAWIKAKKNGNVFEVIDEDYAAELLRQGHEGFVSDPRVKGAKKWDPEAEGDEPEGAPES